MYILINTPSIYINSCIGATSLSTSMVQLCISQKLNENRDCSLKIKAIAGANLFKKFTVKFLTQQVRANGDAKHAKFIASFTTETYPLNAEVLSGLQQYTEDLIKQDAAFKHAPICCSTNVSNCGLHLFHIQHIH